VTIGDVFEVAQDLFLGRESLTPRPFLLEILVERVGVVDALDIAARPGIPVVEPGPAESRGALEAAHAHTACAEPVHGVETGDPGSDDDHIDLAVLGCHCASFISRIHIHSWPQ
jgi:hypothetical protein